MQLSKWATPAFAVLALFSSVWAQEQTEVRIERREGRRPWAEQAHRWQKGNDLIGKVVTLSSGDEIGKVHDMIVDTDSGRVIYYIITFERKYAALPVLTLDLPEDNTKFRVN